MGEPGRIQAFLGWWRELPTGWRVNVGLYVLAGVSLVALLAQVVVGGDSGPRRVEVASGRRSPRTTTTLSVPSITEAPTSTVPPLTTAPPATGGEPVPTLGRPRARGGGGGGTGKGSPAVTFVPTTPTTVPCGRNTTEDRCGPLDWEPDPGPNAGLSIVIEPSSPAETGAPVNFHVVVDDPDHRVTGNCWEVDWGDGQKGSGPCVPAPCENARGVWDTPAKEPGHGDITVPHEFASANTYTVRFTFRTDKDSCPDPYGSVGSNSVQVTVTAPATPPAGE